MSKEIENNVRDLAMEVKKIWTEIQFQLDRIIDLESRDKITNNIEESPLKELMS